MDQPKHAENEAGGQSLDIEMDSNEQSTGPDLSASTGTADSVELGGII
jgi:hypothetical protein